MRAVDVKGAIELARLLKERHGDEVELGSAATPAPEGASPIFHWVGGNPPVVAAEGPDPELPRRARWGRRRGRSSG
jgi:hypothetical protein